MTDNGKQVLLTIDNVRVIQFDDKNVAVELLEPVTRKDTKETVMQWVVRGYYGNLPQAFKGIDQHEWLVDKSRITDIRTAVAEIEVGRKKLLAAVEQMLGG